MKLDELLGCIDVSQDQDQYKKIKFTGLKLDSRQVCEGDLFIAVSGYKTDGKKYIQEAKNNGASAVLVEDILENNNIVYTNINIPIIKIPRLKLKQNIGNLAAHFYDYPSKNMNIVAVTGTNGKTSCVQIISQLLNLNNHSCETIGTLSDYRDNFGLTTPDCISLQDKLSKINKKNIKTCAIEASSHALKQSRLSGTDINIAVFTNLSRDHLDYHSNLDSYWQAKLKLFSQFKAQHIITNLDDSHGKLLADKYFKQGNIIGYSIDYSINKNKYKIPQIKVTNYKLYSTSLEAKISTPWGNGTIVAPMVGKFNLSNLLACISVACVLGIKLDQVLLAISKLQSIAGRMQFMGGQDKNPVVVVDFAHTPDALTNVLNTLDIIKKGNILTVFGCGGDRDPTKRSPMLQIAASKSNKVFITQDNPRTESPQEIIKDMLDNKNLPSNTTIVMDRKQAIIKAISEATNNDIVLISGKGHEDYQIFGTKKIKWSDTECAKEVLWNSY